MPAISRQVGTVSSLINVFIPNATVSTGAGLANIVASTVVFAWCRNDQAAVSSWTLTTGTLGTWAGSTLAQMGSTSTLGWYQLSAPHGLFVSGDMATAHLAGAPNMAPVPILIELTKTDNQTYLSSQTVGFVRNNVSVSTITIPVGVSTGVVSVSAATIPFGVSSISTPVTASTAGVTSISIPVGVSSMSNAVNVSSIYGSAAVTSAAGVWGPLAVSSISTPVTASTAGVTSISIPVTVSAGTVRVSAVTIPVGVSSLTAAALGNFFDTGAVFFSTAVVSSVVYEIATNASAVVGDVNVSSFTAGALGQFFTTDAGDYSTSVLGSVVQEIADNVSATVGAMVGVSSISIPVGVSSISTPVTASTAGVTSISIPVGVSSISTPVTASTAGVTSISIPVSVSAGTVRVSAATIPFGVSSGSVEVTSASAAVYETAADTLLGRNVAGGSNTGRIVKEAFYAIRNRVDLTNGVVYGTDDATSSWAFTTSTSAVDPIVEIDPA